MLSRLFCVLCVNTFKICPTFILVYLITILAARNGHYMADGRKEEQTSRNLRVRAWRHVVVRRERTTPSAWRRISLAVSAFSHLSPFTPAPLPFARTCPMPPLPHHLRYFTIPRPSPPATPPGTTTDRHPLRAFCAARLHRMVPPPFASANWWRRRPLNGLATGKTDLAAGYDASPSGIPACGTHLQAWFKTDVR